MATTENLHTGDASKTKFSFTFPYLNQTDVEVYKYVTNAWVKQTITTHYTFDNATTIKFGSAPAAATTAEQTNLGNTKNIKIKRNTSGDSLAATFYPGSAIRAGDLNDNYTQNLYVTQEASNLVTDASTDAATALTKATSADTKATTALNNSRISTGGTPAGPSDGYTSAMYLADQADTKATNAVTTANAASATVSSVLPYTIIAGAAELQALFGGSDSPAADEIFEITETDDLPVKILSAAWASGTTYKVNDQRTNDSGKLYLCTVAGTSAGSGGPTGTGSSITDNTVTWKYIAAANGIWTINSVPSPLPTFSTGITVKLKYASGDASASTWTWQSYHANNPETRYAPTASPTFTGTVTGPTINASTTLQIGGTAITSTATELNILDGVTSTTAELNKLDGFTGDKDDLIYAKDLKATGVTATEFDYLDGVSSAIQTQLDAKAALASPTFTGTVTAPTVDIDGAYKQTVKTITQSATPTVDLSLGNYFTLTQNANVTSWTFSNAPASRSFSFVIELANASYSTAWSLASGTVKWPADTAPTLAASKTHLIIFVTDDGGTTYRASSLVDYTT